MATNNTLEDTIKSHLDKRAKEDSLFAKSYSKKNKNIKECCAYITSEAKKQVINGCATISDDIVFGWAVHYYDEDNIKVENSSNTRSEVKNSSIKTEVTKEVPKAKTKKKEDINQLSLF